MIRGFLIGWLDLLHLIHSHSSGLLVMQRYRYSTHFQLTVAHALGFSVFTSRILATDLSEFHCNFKPHVKFFWHRLIPFLTIILQLPVLRLDSTTLGYCSTLFCTMPTLSLLPLSCRTLLIATLHGPPGKHSVHCWRSLFSAPLPSNTCPILACLCVAGMCLATCCLAMGIHVTTNVL
jgi:hypothetical protein